MMLDAKAPKFSMCGRLADIVPSAYEVKRRRLHAAHLARKAQQAQLLASVAMVAVLVLAALLQACSTKDAVQHRKPAHSRPRISLLHHDVERPVPTRHGKYDWYYMD